MNKRQVLFSITTSILLFAGCGNIEKEVGPIRAEQEANQTVTTGRVDHGIYQGILTNGTYETSSLRGLTASGKSNGYNQKNFEIGLLHLSKDAYPTDNYYFHEGQILEESDVSKWLNRETKENPGGLNPTESKTPIIFTQLIEYDFYKAKDQSLGGISLGLSFSREEGLSQETLMQHIRHTVNAVLSRVRKMPDMEKLPITIGVFEQADEKDINGGDYTYSFISKKGEQAVDTFEEVDEVYLTLPLANKGNNVAKEEGLTNIFETFRSSLTKAFPEAAGITGRAHYIDKELISLVISIDSKYFSQTEIDSLTQFVGKQIETLFETVKGSVDVQIQDVTSPQAYIGRKVDSKEVVSYQFN